MFVLVAGESHFRSRNRAPRIVDVFLEHFLVPDDARFLVGFGIGVVGDAAGMATVKAVELGSDLIGRARTDVVARHALLEYVCALCRILRERNAARRANQHSGYNERSHSHSPLPSAV